MLLKNSVFILDRLTAINQLFQSFDRIAKIWFGPIPTIGVVHPDLVQKIFLADDIMEKSRYFYGIFGVDESLIATNSEFLEILRRFK